eukprot:CAMPEP_0204033710 /NCGR_PEP_ID=MMETSP0360-20130528/71513_1 /ASSEMBLY_ACC=CAM_ASM_000342 /TAXON_ID=268821 /ORGANISM="Scrippsiella Hangoei, Strain SHTV-5" /LENGTH=40 /DNA_ID= /DNA_START= /DNA_END= /DNA_ORIENTATION=
MTLLPAMMQGATVSNQKGSTRSTVNAKDSAPGRAAFGTWL